MRYTIREVGGKGSKVWDAYYRCRPKPHERRKTDQKRERFFNMTEAQVRKLLDVRLADITKDEHFPKLTIRVGEYLRECIEDRFTNGDIGRLQYERYGLALRQVLAKLDGNLLLTEVTPQHLERCKRELIKSGGGRLDKKTGKVRTATPLSRRTVKQAHWFGVIKPAFARAYRQELIKRDPCEAVEAPKAEYSERAHLEPATLVALMEAVRTREPRLYIAVVLAALAGLRRGEILGLDRDDVDLVKGVVRVRHAVEESKNAITLKGPKSGKPRFVKIPQTAREALAAHFVEQDMMRERIGPAWNADRLVVPYLKTGRLWTPTMLGKTYKVAITALGYPHATLHVLRHTFISLLVANGIDVKSVSAQAGHSNAAMTLGVYAHLQDGARDHAAAVLEAVITANKQGGLKSAP